MNSNKNISSLYNSKNHQIDPNIMSFDEIRQYFFNLEDHLKFKQKYCQSDDVLPWEWTLNDKDLYLYWTMHVLDNTHIQYAYLVERRKQFYEKNKHSNIVILSEGWVRNLKDDDTLASSIDAFWEPGMLAWIAREYSVQIATPEPNETEEVKVLSQKFDLLAVLYYFVWRNAYWTLKKWAPVEFVNDKGTEKIAKLLPWSTITFEELHNSLFPDKPFSQITSKWLAPFMNPLMPEKSIINQVSAWEDDLIRDPYIIQQILQRNQKWYHVFLAYGYDHLVKWQPLLQYWKNKSV